MYIREMAWFTGTDTEHHPADKTDIWFTLPDEPRLCAFGRYDAATDTVSWLCGTWNSIKLSEIKWWCHADCLMSPLFDDGVLSIKPNSAEYTERYADVHRKLKDVIKALPTGTSAYDYLFERCVSLLVQPDAEGNI